METLASRYGFRAQPASAADPMVPATKSRRLSEDMVSLLRLLGKFPQRHVAYAPRRRLRRPSFGLTAVCQEPKLQPGRALGGSAFVPVTLGRGNTSIQIRSAGQGQQRYSGGL